MARAIQGAGIYTNGRLGVVINVTSFSWGEFTPTLVATFLGVLLAFALNSYLSRRVEKRALERSDGERRQRRFFILRSLRDDVEHNNAVLGYLRDELQRVSPVLDFSVSLGFWRMFGSEATQSVRDVQSIQYIMQFYQNLEHLARSLSLYTKLLTRTDAAGIRARQQTLERLEQRVTRGLELGTPLLEVMVEEVGFLSVPLPK